MNKVITVNLNGSAYQLEEAAYEKLQRYLESARTALNGNPDQAEIMRDLEEALGDKCARYRTAHKSVILSEEIDTIIDEMGPVSAASTNADPNSEPAANAASGPKKLYRVLDGAWVAGVGAGLAAYFDIDVVLIRILFMILLFITHGGFIFGYLLLAIFIPPADTREAWAKAHGFPFTAQKLVDRAHEELNDLSKKQGTKSERWARKMERKTMRATRKSMKNSWKYGAYTYTHPNTGPLTGLAHAVLAVLFILGILSLVTSHAILGVVIPVGMPIWVAIIIFAIVFNIVRWPIMAIVHGLSYSDANSRPWHMVEALVVLVVLTLGGIFIVHHPEVLQQGVNEANTALVQIEQELNK